MLLIRFVIVIVLFALVTLAIYLFVEIPRKLIERAYVYLGGEKPGNMRSFFGVSGAIAAIVAVLSYVISTQFDEDHQIVSGFLKLMAALNALISIAACFQYIFNQQYELRGEVPGVRKYKCPICGCGFRLSYLPVSGAFTCWRCYQPLWLEWNGEFAPIPPDFGQSRPTPPPEIPFGYHIFSGRPGESPTWLASITGGNTAYLQMKQMAADKPGCYFIRSECMLDVVASIDTSKRADRLSSASTSS